MEQFTFTVGKLDAGMAILIGERAHLIEFPSLLLPPGVTSGSIVNISVNRNISAEEAHKRDFWSLQDEILQAYGLAMPKTPLLKLRHVTQTSVTLEWDSLELAQASCKGLEIYKNGQRLALIPNPTTNTSTKLSSLQSNEEYSFHLVLKTTAGTLQSNTVKVRTHTMSDTSGISVCFGIVDDPNALSHAKNALDKMHAKWTDKIQIDTTHFVCTRGNAQQQAGSGSAGPSSEYQKAVQLSLPIVQPQWILACQHERRLMPISHFQLGVPVAAYSTSEPARFVRPPSQPNSPAAGGGGGGGSSSTLPRRDSILADQQAQASEIHRAPSPETKARASFANGDEGSEQKKPDEVARQPSEERSREDRPSPSKLPSLDLQAARGPSFGPKGPQRPKSPNQGRLDRNFRMPTGSTPPASAKSSDEVTRAKQAEIKGTRTNAEVEAEAAAASAASSSSAKTDSGSGETTTVKTVHGKTVSDFQRSVKAADQASMPPLPASASGVVDTQEDGEEEVALQETPVAAESTVDIQPEDEPKAGDRKAVDSELTGEKASSGEVTDGAAEGAAGAAVTSTTEKPAIEAATADPQVDAETTKDAKTDEVDDVVVGTEELPSTEKKHDDVD